MPHLPTSSTTAWNYEVLSINISANLIKTAAAKVVNLQPLLIYYLSTVFSVRNFHFASSLIPGFRENSEAAWRNRGRKKTTKNLTKFGTSPPSRCFPITFARVVLGLKPSGTRKRLANAKSVSVEVFGRLCNVLTRSDSM